MLLIFSCGTPVTGRTTSCNQLREYFDSIGVSYQVFRESYGSRYNKDAIKLNIYRWVIEKTSEVVIVDGVLYNYFDRKEIIDEVERAKSVNGADVYIAAIQHTRTVKFSFEHNEDAGHYPYSNKAIINIARVYQQPIKREGIGVIRHVRSSNRLDVDAFMADINRKFNLNYPVKEFVLNDHESDEDEDDENITGDDYHFEPEESVDVHVYTNPDTYANTDPITFPATTETNQSCECEDKIMEVE